MESQTTTAPKVKPIPDGMHTVTPHLCCAGAGKAIDFYVKAFGALPAELLTPASGRTPERAVLFYATDDDEAAATAERLITAAGFAPVKAGGVADTRRIEVFGDLHAMGGLDGRLLTTTFHYRAVGSRQRGAAADRRVDLVHRLLEPGDIPGLLAGTGLTLIASWGGFDGRPLAPPTEQHIYLLRRGTTHQARGDSRRRRQGKTKR